MPISIDLVFAMTGLRPYVIKQTNRQPAAVSAARACGTSALSDGLGDPQTMLPQERAHVLASGVRRKMFASKANVGGRLNVRNAVIDEKYLVRR